MPNQSMLDNIATDLANWIDQTSTQIAAAMAPQGVAPFAADLDETQKLEYYRSMLFNPDGTPNLQGRSAEINRLGPQGFASVYKAVIAAYPSLKLPTPPGAPEVPASQMTPAPPPSPVPAPLVPRSIAAPHIAQITPIVPPEE